MQLNKLDCLLLNYIKDLVVSGTCSVFSCNVRGSGAQVEILSFSSIMNCFIVENKAVPVIMGISILLLIIYIYRKKVKKLKKSLLFHMVYNRLIKQSIDCVKYAAPQYYSTAVFWKAEYIRLGYVCISHDNRGDEYDFEM